MHTTGYWKHIWNPISWTLIVDDFGFKYTNKRHVDELLKIMSQWYVMKMDWEGTSFGGITLKWNYKVERQVELYLPGYIDKILARFRHPQPKIPQDPQICCIIFIPFLSRRGDSLGDGGAGVVHVNFVGGTGCGESCGLFGWGWRNRSRIFSMYPGRETSTHRSPS